MITIKQYGYYVISAFALTVFFGDIVYRIAVEYQLIMLVAFMGMLPGWYEQWDKIWCTYIMKKKAAGCQ